MIFDEGHVGYHMMDWNLGHWIPMIFGLGIVLLASIVIIYMVIQNTRTNNEKNQMTIQLPKSNKHELNAYGIEEENSEKANFCYRCGEKLDGEQSNYCPKCGSKVSQSGELKK